MAAGDDEVVDLFYSAAFYSVCGLDMCPLVAPAIITDNQNK